MRETAYDSAIEYHIGMKGVKKALSKIPHRLHFFDFWSDFDDDIDYGIEKFARKRRLVLGCDSGLAGAHRINTSKGLTTPIFSWLYWNPWHMCFYWYKTQMGGAQSSPCSVVFSIQMEK